MGSCCSTRSVSLINENKNKQVSRSRRTSILLEQISKQTDYKKKYDFVSILGNGSFGKVRLFRDKHCPDLRFAIKTIKKNFLNPHSIKSLIQEVEILIKLDHPNIVKYFETYEDDHYLHIVMEYIPGDNLFKVISQRKYNNFSEKDAAEILNCIFKSVYYLHQNKIVHRDIKPENILFSLPGKYSSLKLIDFGLSTSLSSKDNYRVGSPYYMAPEMLEGKYDYATDIWSMGVILFVMMTGTYPFPGKEQNEVFEKIKIGIYDIKLLDKQKASTEVKDLIKRLLVLEINKRLTIEEALKHPWIENNLKNENNLLIDDNIIKSISNFAKNNIVQKEILFYIAKISSESEISKIKEAFMEFDKDKSGTIETDEIITIFRKLGKNIDINEVKEIWEGLDFHNDGKVYYSEFLAATISSVKFIKEEKLWSAFKYFEEHDKGYITSGSMIDALKSSNIPVNESGLNHIFESLNKRNKRLNFEEFKELYENRK